MTAKERGLTGLALALLAYWELTIGEIPLGLFAIRYHEHPAAFTILLGLELLLASVWLSRALLQWYRRSHAPVAASQSRLFSGFHLS